MSTLLAPSRPALVVGPYCVRLATSPADLEAAQRLRFEVFNLELHEGLDTAYLSGLDADRFDECCDHILVEDTAAGKVVGTYRLQTGQLAAAHHGYYSAQEFEFAPYEPIRCETVELGRACVDRRYRGMPVLSLLWRGIILYTTARRARYLIGCSSLTTQDAICGWQVYEELKKVHLTDEPYRTNPLEDFRLPEIDAAAHGTPRSVHVPKLLRTYLSLGAKICGPPAIDREFKTIDFLTLVDLHALHGAARGHFSE